MLQIDRSTVRYLSRRDDDTDLGDAIKRVFRERRRFGYRRIHVMIAREDFTANHKKVRRIYTEEKLAGAAQRRQEVCFGHEEANGAAQWSERTLEFGFCVRCAEGWSSLPHFCRES